MFFCHSCVSRGSAVQAVLNNLQEIVGLSLWLALTTTGQWSYMV